MLYIIIEKISVLWLYENAMFKCVGQVLANFESVIKKFIGRGFQISLYTIFCKGSSSTAAKV